MKKYVLTILVVVLAFSGYALATHVTTTEEHVVVFDPPPMTTTIQDTDQLPHETTTVVVTETVEPPTTSTEPPTTSTEPPPTTTTEPEPGTKIVLIDERFRCFGALEDFGELPIIVETHMANDHPNATHPRGLYELSGCYGDGDPGTTDLVIQAHGNGRELGTGGDLVVVRDFSHDITVEGFGHCGFINPGGPGPGDEAHQDGWDIRIVRNLLIRDFELGDWDNQAATCQGAGGLFYPSAFLNNNPNGPEDDPALVQNVICERCKMVAWKPFDPEANNGGRAAFIVQSMDSGAVDSCFSARLPFQIDNRAIRPIDVNNLKIDRDSTAPQPAPSECTA